MTDAVWPGLAAWEAHIHAFAAIVPPPAIAGHGRLKGLRVGVKDIIDVVDLPTRNGSAACADAPPADVDASCVAALRREGASIVGKTVTTEFAFIDPTDCRNPHDLARSPGGSSSGSGAAVAAGVVDIALGTQTAGSLCRPAPYCGVVGLKPSYGALSTAGVTPLARSFDAIGIIARDVPLARLAFEVMSGAEGEAQGDGIRATRWLLPGSTEAAPEMAEALEAATQAIAQLTRVGPAPDVACDTDGIVAAHRIVMLAEAAEAHGYILGGEKAGQLRPKFRSALAEGLALSADQVAAARAVLTRAKTLFWQAMEGIDVILTLPVPDGAPMIGDSTGFQNWLTPWTVFGGPLISLPWGIDGHGRPRAVMLAGRPGADLRVLDLAAQLGALAPPVPTPILPRG